MKPADNTLKNTTEQLEAELFNAISHLIINDCRLIPYKIKLIQPWRSASSHLHYRQGFLLRLIINDSLSATSVQAPSIQAIGECAPMAEIGTESLEQAQQFLEKKSASLSGKAIAPELLSDMSAFPASRFALETALLSLLGQYQKKNIAQLLKPQLAPETQHKIKTNIMLGTLDKNNSLDKAKKAEAEGFTCLKIKMGLADIDTETKTLSHLLKQLLPTTRVRLDANKSWTYDQTNRLLDSLAQNFSGQIDSIEEPLLEFNAKQYQSLQNKTSIALALDESFALVNFSSVTDRKQFPVRRLILKPTAQGGIIKSWILARLAQQAKIETVITSSIETAYGLWPITYLCAALNESANAPEHIHDNVHGLATASWLEDTLIKPPEIRHGTIII